MFIADTYVNPDPTAEQIAEITLLAAEEMRRFGLTPKVALLSHSNFGTQQTRRRRRRCATRSRCIQRSARPTSRSKARCTATPRCRGGAQARVPELARSTGEANLLIMPTLDAANISFNLLKIAAGGGVTLGPILLGAAKPVHILTPSATVRRIVNMTALTVVDCTIDRQAQLAYSTSA